MIASTNLARRPFRNERLPWLFSGLLLTAGVLVSVAHARFTSELLSRDEAATVRKVAEDEKRIVELEALLSKEPPARLETAERVRLQAFKELVDRRVFPWRQFLSELEATLSDDVRFTRIAPAEETGGGMLIALSGQARSKDAAFSLAENLDASPAFSRAALKSLSENDGLIEFDLEVVFEPSDSAALPPETKP